MASTGASKLILQRGRIKACTECRQQKLKCDARKDYSRPCSRCANLNLQCIVSTSFRRRKKQTKAELQKEIEKLRSGADPAPATVLLGQSGASIPETSKAQLATPLSSQTSPDNSVSHALKTRIEAAYLATISRTLAGCTVDPQQINDCWRLYFKEYFPLMSVVDVPTTTPNDTYGRSQILFWSIVVTGARKYPADPSLFWQLAPHVTALALSSLAYRANPVQLVQALLNLCTWPMPSSSQTKDISHVLAGATLHIAMQIGLHVYGNGQDFGRTRLPDDTAVRNCRARLWLYCLIICQATCTTDGIPPPVVTDSSHFERDRRDMEESLSIESRFNFKLHTLLTNSVVSILKTVSGLSSYMGTSVMNSLIEAQDEQCTYLIPEAPGKVGLMILNLVRLQLGSFYFFAQPSEIHVQGFIRLYAIACAVITAANEIKNPIDLTISCTVQVAKCILLANCAILKIWHSQIREHLDLEAGRAAYFAGIDFFRKLSIQPDDLMGRSSIILSQLWTSTMVFKRKDGVKDSLSLNIRSRLGMSVVFDCFWWWRQEFTQLDQSPYVEDDEEMTSVEHTPPDEIQMLPPPVETGLPHPSLVAEQWRSGFEFLGLPDPISNIPVAKNPAPPPQVFTDVMPNPNMFLPVDGFPDFDWASNFDFTAFETNIVTGLPMQ